VPGAPGLQVLNIDPETAAEAYRVRVLAQLDAHRATPSASTVREQLSGACTTEIAAFDEFAALLAGATRDGVGPRGLRHGAHRPHAAAAQPAEGLDRVSRGQRPRRLVPGAALRTQDAGARFNVRRWPPW
jgi:hypothetical protein